MKVLFLGFVRNDPSEKSEFVWQSSKSTRCEYIEPIWQLSFTVKCTLEGMREKHPKQKKERYFATKNASSLFRTNEDVKIKFLFSSLI